MQKNLQIAVVEFLQKIFNEKYKEISGDTLDLYKFSTILDWNFDEFKHFEKNGKLVIDKYNFHNRYVQVNVEGLIGDYEPIPETVIINANIPITMIVGFQDIDITLATINAFSKSSIGKIYELNFSDYNGVENFKIAFVPSLPDYADFNIVQGNEIKPISFDLACVISNNVYWGNSIEYSLSIDNGNTYTKLYKIEPVVKKDSDLYTNQIIGQDISKSTIKANVWSKSFSILAQNNSLCNYLIKYIDFGSDYFQMQPINAKLKIKYNGIAGYNYSSEENDTTNEFVKDVILSELSYSDNIGDFITINISMVDAL